MKVHLSNNNAWSDGNEYIMGTASEVHTNTLFDIYPNDTTITAEFKGNTQQNGTPSPSAPVPVVGVGYLDGTAYKIPVEIGLSTQSIDLSAVQTIRYISRLVLDGTENWEMSVLGAHNGFLTYAPSTQIGTTNCICTHYKVVYSNTNNSMYFIANPINGRFVILDDRYSSSDDFKAYLAAQYANGTPVCVWYVLAESTTGITNEPLQKIGDYADSISNITLTTTAGATSFGVDTAVKPSEITLNFRGWHPKDPKESTGGEWG